MKLRIGCPGHGNKNRPKLMLVGERPGKREYDHAVSWKYIFKNISWP